MKRGRALCAIACVAAGCAGGARGEHVAIAPRADAVPVERVTFLPEGSGLGTDIRELGFVRAVAPGADVADSVVLSQLREEAAALGCDVVAGVHVDRDALGVTASGVCGLSR